MKEEQIKKLLEELFEGEELNDCYIIDVNVNGKKIEVFLDSDTEMGFNRCRRISRYLENIFDETQAFGEKYTLDVSSPGVGTPLKFKRQYAKNIGRKVEVVLKSTGAKVKGELKEVNENDIAVEFMIKEKQGKKNIKKTILQKIEEEDIEKITVKISF